MLPERKQRYRQKINFIVEKVKSLPLKPADATEVDALLYRILLAIEAAMDLAAMAVKDKGYTVSDDYHNIEQLVTLKVISSSAGEELKKLNGLRNAIVHKYNKFEEEVVLKAAEHIVKVLVSFLKSIEHELKNLTKNKK